MVGEIQVFVCGESFRDIRQYETIAERGKKVVEAYLSVAELIVLGQREEIQQALVHLPDSKTENFLAVSEKIAAFRQTLMTVFGIETPGYGLILANLDDDHIQDVVLAVSEQQPAPSPPQRGEYKMAKKQTKQLATLLQEFYKGALPYQISFVVSRTSTGYKHATVAFAEPSSFADLALVDSAKSLLRISKLQFDTVWAPTEPRLPHDNELARARLEGIKYQGQKKRTTKELAKIHAIVLTSMLKTRNFLDGKLSNSSQSALVLEISAVYNSFDPLIKYTFADEFIKQEQEMQKTLLRYQTIKDALQGLDSPVVRNRVEMAQKIIDSTTQKLETPQRALKILEQYVRQDFWGQNCLPFLIIYRDHSPHAPVWFVVRVFGKSLEDDKSALGQELERLDSFVREGEIPEPPPARSYAEVVSDSG